MGGKRKIVNHCLRATIYIKFGKLIISSDGFSVYITRVQASWLFMDKKIMCFLLMSTVVVHEGCFIFHDPQFNWYNRIDIYHLLMHSVYFNLVTISHIIMHLAVK